MANGLTETGRAQINVGITLNLALFIACMAFLVLEGLKKVKKNEGIFNVFVGTGIGALSSAVADAHRRQTRMSDSILYLPAMARCPPRVTKAFELPVFFQTTFWRGSKMMLSNVFGTAVPL